MIRPLLQIGLMIFITGWISAMPTSADEIRPALLDIKQQGTGLFTLTWKVPMRGARVLAITPQLPAALELVGTATLQQVPGVQKRLTRVARQHGKPVVIATQMLESMISAPVPTRAEVSDVATAVFEGADAVMLSAESAAGQYPVEAVATMDGVAQAIEQDALYDQIIHAQRPEPDASSSGALGAAACSIADDARLTAIICYTSTGATALRVARQRPRQPILALSTGKATARRLTIAWGLHCVLTEDPHSVADMVTRACRLAAREGMVELNNKVIVSAGLPFGTPGATNMLRVVKIDAQAVRVAKTRPETTGPFFN